MSDPIVVVIPIHFIILGIFLKVKVAISKITGIAIMAPE